jgi:hypothetical protein
VSKSNATENDLVKFVFNGTAIPWGGAGNLYVSLHTADPGEGGDQSTSEATYTGYARVAVSRDSGGWTVVGPLASNVAQIQFGLCTAGSETITHFAVGTASVGAGQILYSGALNSSIAVSNNVQPQFAAAALQVTED